MIIFKMYQPFFEIDNWTHVITSGKDWLMILTLILMECLLSIDNAAVLTARTQVLPTKLEKEKFLLYGLWGAYTSRFIIIGVGAYLVHLWEIKLADSIYLFYLSFEFFYKQHHPEKVKQKHERDSYHKSKKYIFSLFWRTVISIELMDIIFSIDSVLAALAISEDPVIILIGGMIGVLCMRGVVEIIIKLMEHISEPELMAYVLTGFIAMKLLLDLSSLEFEIPNNISVIIIFTVLGITILFHFWRIRRHGSKHF